MINKKLFDDPKDHTIAQLRMAIKKYKQHDRTRTEYYKGVLAENAWMKEKLDHAILLDPDEEPTNTENALLSLQKKLTEAKEKHKEYKRQIDDLTTIIDHERIFSSLTPDEMKMWKSDLELARHEQRLLKAQADADRFRKANSELATQLEQLRREHAVNF